MLYKFETLIFNVGYVHIVKKYFTINSEYSDKTRHLPFELLSTEGYDDRVLRGRQELEAGEAPGNLRVGDLKQNNF